MGKIILDGIEYGGGGGTVDTAMSDSSTNAVQNKVIKTYVDTTLGAKQDTLVSGTNVKTINNQSVLGAGNIDVGGVETFLVKPNVTTYDELKQAILAGKIIYVDAGVGARIVCSTSRVVDDPTFHLNIALFGAQTSANPPGVEYSFLSFYMVDKDNNWTGDSFLPQRMLVGQGATQNIKTINNQNVLGQGNIAIGVNFAVDEETWYGTYKDENGVIYQVYTKTIYIPALPATAGITTYNHGIANIKQILSVYGFTTDGFVLNAPRQNAQDNIAIFQASRSASNQTISIEVGKDRSSKKAYVTLIYAKNN